MKVQLANVEQCLVATEARLDVSPKLAYPTGPNGPPGDPDVAAADVERLRAEIMEAGEEAERARADFAAVQMSLEKALADRRASDDRAEELMGRLKEAEEEARAARDQVALVTAEVEKAREERRASDARAEELLGRLKEAEEEACAARDHVALVTAEVEKAREELRTAKVRNLQQEAALVKQGRAPATQQFGHDVQHSARDGRILEPEQGGHDVPDHVRDGIVLEREGGSIPEQGNGGTAPDAATAGRATAEAFSAARVAAVEEYASLVCQVFPEKSKREAAGVLALEVAAEIRRLRESEASLVSEVLRLRDDAGARAEALRQQLGVAALQGLREREDPAGAGARRGSGEAGSRPGDWLGEKSRSSASCQTVSEPSCRSHSPQPSTPSRRSDSIMVPTRSLVSRDPLQTCVLPWLGFALAKQESGSLGTASWYPLGKMAVWMVKRLYDG